MFVRAVKIPQYQGKITNSYVFYYKLWGYQIMLKGSIEVDFSVTTKDNILDKKKK